MYTDESSAARGIVSEAPSALVCPARCLRICSRAFPRVIVRSMSTTLLPRNGGGNLAQSATVVSPHGSGVPSVSPIGVRGVPLSGGFAAVRASATVIDPFGDEAQELEVLIG